MSADGSSGPGALEGALRGMAPGRYAIGAISPLSPALASKLSDGYPRRLRRRLAFFGGTSTRDG